MACSPSPQGATSQCSSAVGFPAVHFGFSRTLCGSFRSCRHEHALAQQRKACAAIRGPLDGLQSVDLSFNGTATPRGADRSGDGVGVTLKPMNETVQQAATRQAHPGFQSRRGLRKVAAALTEQRRKSIGQLTGAGHRGCDLSEMTKEGPLLCLELVRRRAEQAGAEPRRGHGPYCGLSFGVHGPRIFLASPLRGPAYDTALTAAVALSAELAPEPCAIATAFSPATGEKPLRGRDIVRLFRLLVRRRPASLEPAIDRQRTGADGAADGMPGRAEPMQPYHLLVAAAALVMSLRPQPLHACNRRRRGHHWRGGARGDGAMPIHHALQGFAKVVEEMPPICDLESIGCPLPGRLGIGASAIARDDLDAFMMLQPIRDGGGLAVGQQVDDGVALEVDQDGAVVLATLPSPLINPHHPQRRMRRSLSATNEPQQRIGTERHGQAGSKTRARFAAEAQAKLALDTGQPRPASCRAGGTLTQRIGEGPPCTSGIAAQETAHANQQCCRTPLTRQVLQSPVIGLMNAARGL